MGDIPVLKPSEVIAILEAMGFFEARQKGGHKQFRHADGSRGGDAPKILSCELCLKREVH